MIRIRAKNGFNRNDARHVIDLLNRKFDLQAIHVEAIHELPLRHHDDDCNCGMHKSLINSIPGIGHPVPVIGQMELQIYNLIDWNRFLVNLFRFLGLKIRKAEKGKTIHESSVQKELIYKPDGSTFTLAELEIINNFIRDELKILPSAIEASIVRSYIIGNIIQAMQEAKEAKKVIDLAALPKTVIEMSKKYKLSPQETNVVNYAISNVGNQISGITDQARKNVVQKVIEARFEGKSHEELALDLYHEVTDTDKNLNRDWSRVAITEANGASANGFVAGCGEGDEVVWVSLPGACDFCKEQDNKIFTITKTPPPDYANLDPGSDEYKKLSKLWETAIWTGKTNRGRSGAKKKRIGEGDYEEREHHEMMMPTIPAHPWCRCYWKKL